MPATQDTVNQNERLTESVPAGSGGGAGRMIAAIHGNQDITPDDRNAFPCLEDDAVEAICRFGEFEDHARGDLLFERGQRSVDFFLVMEGCIEIVNHPPCGSEEVVTIHGERQFTGELDLFNDRKILVSGRMGVDGRVLRVRRGAFREMLAAEPEVAGIIMKAFILRRLGLIENQQGGVRLLGRPDSGDTLTLQRFLDRNGYPQELIHVEDPDDPHLKKLDKSLSDCPIALCPNGEVLSRPTLSELAGCIGISQDPVDGETFDTVVVGGGPAGLAAAVYAASEGLSTLILESEAPGGQAGTSSRIENYLGFPLGLSGQQLAARAQLQAEKFGARLALPRRVKRLHCDDHPYRIDLEDGPAVRARTVVCATGARYRKLELDDYAAYEGGSIHYAATAVEAQICEGQDIYVVGGGNSAGQAAVFLARRSKHVHLLVRGPGLKDSMSSYLIERINASENITLHTHTEVVALHGDPDAGRLEGLTLLRKENRDADDGERQRVDTHHVFMMIGAQPNTDWLRGCIRLDSSGFICTDHDARPRDGETPDHPVWEADRNPLPGETSQPGVFAVGDCRAGSVKRVASAVGEGSVCIAALHRALAGLTES